MGDKTSGVDMIYQFGNKKPSISKSAFIAETAFSIQDNSVIHSDENEVKNNALIGMNATILHGVEICEI
jgi:carbonic anhydrase/acetyltransferase-like protein (isoleucine patch superfamily)